MRYVSTRGGAEPQRFSDILLEGLAPDGGLYVPTEVPPLPADWDAERPYAELASAVMWPYVQGSIERDYAEHGLVLRLVFPVGQLPEPEAED